MEFFGKLKTSCLKLISSKKKELPSEEQQLALKLQPYEFYLYKIQGIATWEEPSESILALFLVNVVFFLLSFFHWRFYGIVFSILCLLVAHEAWVDHIWPEIRVPQPEGAVSRPDSLPLKEGMLTIPEISQYATGIRAAVSGQYNRLRKLRQTQPPVYCIIVSACCVVIAGIGSIFSGATLIYLMAMLALSAPGVFKHVLPPEWKQQILKTLKSASKFLVPPEGSMEEYFPDITSKEIKTLLSQAGENNDLSPPSTSDSSLGDLVMPGYDECSVDAMDSLLPTIPQESSRESSDSEGVLQFKPKHFKETSMAGYDDSTDDESLLIKDLDFPDVSPTTKTGGLKDAVTSVLYRTFPTAFTPAKPVFEKLENDDSDSDFEIIETENIS